MSSIVAMRVSSMCRIGWSVPTRILQNRFALVTRVRSFHEAISIALIRDLDRALDRQEPKRRLIVGELENRTSAGIEFYRLLNKTRIETDPNVQVWPVEGEVKLEIADEIPQRLEARIDLLRGVIGTPPASLFLKGVYLPWHGEILAKWENL